MHYLLDIEHRIPEGPRLIGMFPSPEAATQWVQEQQFEQITFLVRPVAMVNNPS